MDMTSNGKPTPPGLRGGGTIVQRVTLTDKAAAYVKARATILGPRYRKQDANETASAIIEAFEHAILITPDMIAALPMLEDARQHCQGDAERGIAQLIAALWVASNAER